MESIKEGESRAGLEVDKDGDLVACLAQDRLGSRDVLCRVSNVFGFVVQVQKVNMLGE